VKVFADTSGFFALMVSNDLMHMQAKQNFAYFSKNQVQLVTSSFVLVETTALLQRRIGLAPVHDFNAKLLPLLDVIWVDCKGYTLAMQRLLVLNNRNVSLVDCVSFEIMEAQGITHAFTFDKHFEENGFAVYALHDSDVGRSSGNG
jgi:predicted nucleic acid-binding protein